MDKYWYLVQDLAIYPSGADLNTVQMVKYAKRNLKHNKRMGLDKGFTQKDLSKPINAWVYLKNIGLGKETNRKKW